jgi:hypothetical protein
LRYLEVSKSVAAQSELNEQQSLDRVGHPAVFSYGAVFALLGMVALMALIPNGRPTHA